MQKILIVTLYPNGLLGGSLRGLSNTTDLSSAAKTVVICPKTVVTFYTDENFENPSSESTGKTFKVVVTDGKAEITAQDKSSVPAKLIIPEKVFDGTGLYPVKSIGEGAFNGCTSLTSVEIPASVENIGKDAFKNCSNLANVTAHWDSNLPTLGTDAFNGIKSGASLHVPTGKASAYSAWAGSFNNIAEQKTTSFYTDADFSNPSTNNSGKVFGVNITNGKASIKVLDGAQNSVSGNFAIPETVSDGTSEYSVTGIEGNAFKNCANLTSVAIPASVKSIGNNAFNGCTNLASATFAKGSRLDSIGNDAFNGCSSLKAMEIPASVESIGNNAFKGCTNLKNFTFAKGSRLDSIGNDTFNGCSSLEEMEIPAPVKSIGNNAFNGCTNLKNLTFAAGSKLATIGNDAFNGCSSLREIKIPASVTNIGVNAFKGNRNLASVTFAAGSKLSSIGNSAFEGCSSLTEITIPSSVRNIGNEAFKNCSKLAHVTVLWDSNPATFGTDAFSGIKSDATLHVPSGKTSVYSAWTSGFHSTYDEPLKYEGFKAGSKEITSANAADVFGDGKVAFRPSIGTKGNPDYKPAKFTLDGAKINSGNEPAIKMSSDFEFELNGDSEVSSIGNSAINITDGADFTVSGTGNLTATSSDPDYPAISVTGNFTIRTKGNVTAKGGSNSCGILTTGQFTVEPGVKKITATGGKSNYGAIRFGSISPSTLQGYKFIGSKTLNAKEDSCTPLTVGNTHFSVKKRLMLLASPVNAIDNLANEGEGNLVKALRAPLLTLGAEEVDGDAACTVFILPLPQHTHDLTKVEAKAATCTESGISTTYWVCDGEDACGKYFSNADGADEHEITAETVEGYVIPQKEHSYTGTVRHNSDGTHSFRCVNGCGTYGGTEKCADKNRDGYCDVCHTRMRSSVNPFNPGQGQTVRSGNLFTAAIGVAVTVGVAVVTFFTIVGTFFGGIFH